MASKVHRTALVSHRAKIGRDVEIGPFSIVNDSVTLGDGCTVGSHCELGVPTPLAESGDLIIGPGSTIRSHSVFYIGSAFGPRLVTGHRVTVRENTVAGINLQIGTLSDIQGHCRFGDYVRFHSNVHIGQRSRLGDCVWIFPYVVLTNDPHPPSEVRLGCEIGDFAIVATMSTVMPGVRIGHGALVGAMTLVQKDVPEDAICVGVPGRVVGDTSRIRLKDTGEPAYPWRRHFHRGYPAELVAQWVAEFATTDGKQA